VDRAPTKKTPLEKNPIPIKNILERKANEENSAEGRKSEQKSFARTSDALFLSHFC
jgi:hypothetical protein